MATMSSPAQRRLDHWHSLETAAQRLPDAVEAGVDTDQPAARSRSCFADARGRTSGP
jgi:hypothetical protein